MNIEAILPVLVPASFVAALVTIVVLRLASAGDPNDPDYAARLGLLPTIGLGLAAVALSIAAVWLGESGFETLHRLRDLERTPRTEAVAVLSGEVNLGGRVEADGPLLQAPRSGAPCVYFLYTVEKRTRDSDGDEHWNEIERRSDVVPFLLADASGTIPVRPAGRVTFRTEGTDLSETVGDLRYTEWRIEPGEPVFLFGYRRGRRRGPRRRRLPRRGPLHADHLRERGARRAPGDGHEGRLPLLGRPGRPLVRRLLRLLVRPGPPDPDLPGRDRPGDGRRAARLGLADDAGRPGRGPRPDAADRGRGPRGGRGDARGPRPRLVGRLGGARRLRRPRGLRRPRRPRPSPARPAPDRPGPRRRPDQRHPVPLPRAPAGPALGDRPRAADPAARRRRRGDGRPRPRLPPGDPAPRPRRRARARGGRPGGLRLVVRAEEGEGEAVHRERADEPDDRRRRRLHRGRRPGPPPRRRAAALRPAHRSALRPVPLQGPGAPGLGQERQVGDDRGTPRRGPLPLPRRPRRARRPPRRRRAADPPPRRPTRGSAPLQRVAAGGRRPALRPRDRDDRAGGDGDAAPRTGRRALAPLCAQQLSRAGPDAPEGPRRPVLVDGRARRPDPADAARPRRRRIVPGDRLPGRDGRGGRLLRPGRGDHPLQRPRLPAEPGPAGLAQHRRLAEEAGRPRAEPGAGRRSRTSTTSGASRRTWPCSGTPTAAAPCSTSPTPPRP